MRWRSRNADAQRAPAREALAVLQERVRPDFRRAVAFWVLAVAALVVGTTYGDVSSRHLPERVTGWGCALVCLLFGVIGSRSAAAEVRRITEPRAGAGAATALGIGTVLIGYIVTFLFVLDLMKVPLERLLVGGAVTGVILGIAAQQSLANLFAGLVLLFSRPYLPGDRIKIYSGAIGGPHVGTVRVMGLTYTSLDCEDGPINIPNSALLAAAVGPAPDEESEDETRLADDVVPTPAPE
jgi:small-conductance mechanosensitive channel